jgi:hypothetical protein
LEVIALSSLQVVSCNAGRKTLTVRVTVDGESWKEKYKLNDEGSEWRWPEGSHAASAAADKAPEPDNLGDKNRGTSLEAEEAVKEDEALPEERQGACQTQTPAAPSAADSAARASPAASDAPAIVGGQEVKQGAVIECACQDDESSTVEWLRGTGGS